MIDKTSIDIFMPHEDFLIHYGILGMKWGVRKDRSILGKPKSSNINKTSFRDRSYQDYINRGYSQKDSEILAARKDKIRTAALVAGGVTVAIGVAFVARHLIVSRKDVLLKAGKKTYHIARGEIKDLEQGRQLFVTIDQADRFAYRQRLNNPKQVDRIERVFETMKDIKIPSPKTSEKLYAEFVSDPNNKKLVIDAMAKSNAKMTNGIVTTARLPDYQHFNTTAPYFSKGKSWHEFGSDNPEGVNAWKSFQKFLENKGYQGVLDENDRLSKSFAVERPTILFDAAKSLKEVKQKKIGGPAVIEIPTLKQLRSPEAAGITALIGGHIALSTKENTSAIEAYRRVYPNTNKTNKQILQQLKDSGFKTEVYREMAKISG